MHVARFLFNLSIYNNCSLHLISDYKINKSHILNWYVLLTLLYLILSCSLPLSVLPLILYYKQFFFTSFCLSFYKCGSYLLQSNSNPIFQIDSILQLHPIISPQLLRDLGKVIFKYLIIKNLFITKRDRLAPTSSTLFPPRRQMTNRHRTMSNC